MMALVYALLVASAIVYFIVTMRTYFRTGQRHTWILVVPFWFIFHWDLPDVSRGELATAVCSALVAVLSALILLFLTV